MTKNKYFIAFMMIAASMPAVARDTFEISIDIDGKGSGNIGFDSAEEALNELDSDGFRNLVPDYQDSDTGTAILDFRGIKTFIDFPNGGTGSNSSELIFSIPELNFEKVFQGPYRDNIREKLENFLENNDEGIFKDLLQALAEETPVDPVAGNPNSIMSRMGASSFEQGSNISTQDSVSRRQSGSNANRIGLEARLGRHSAGDFVQDSLTVPFSYDVVFSDPRYRLKFDAPITVIDTEGTVTYNGSFGLGFQFPVTDKWTLTPGARIGAIGSADAASAAVVNSGSVTSSYDLYLGDIRLTVANNGSYFRTESINAGNYTIDYDLENWMTKNGVALEGYTGLSFFGIDTTWQTNMSHTQIFGDPLFIESYVDVAASLGTKNGRGFFNNLRLGVTVTEALGEDYNAVLANFGYTF